MSTEQPSGSATNGESAQASGSAGPPSTIVQTYLQQQLTPKQLYDKMAAMKAAAKPGSRWLQVRVVLTAAEHGEPVKCWLQCKQCDSLLSPSKKGKDVARTVLRKFWGHAGTCSYPGVAEAAIRLLFMHPTSCASERNWSLWGNVFTKSRNRLAITRAEKLIFIRGNTAAAGHYSTCEDLLQLLEGEGEA